MSDDIIAGKSGQKICIKFTGDSEQVLGYKKAQAIANIEEYVEYHDCYKWTVKIKSETTVDTIRFRAVWAETDDSFWKKKHFLTCFSHYPIYEHVGNDTKDAIQHRMSIQNLFIWRVLCEQDELYANRVDVHDNEITFRCLKITRLGFDLRVFRQNQCLLHLNHFADRCHSIFTFHNMMLFNEAHLYHLLDFSNYFAHDTIVELALIFYDVLPYYWLLDILAYHSDMTYTNIDVSQHLKKVYSSIVALERN